MKSIIIEQTTLAACVQDAQSERIIITRSGVPVALMVGIEGMDEEQVQFRSSDEFWILIAERRCRKTITRTELENNIINRK